MINLQLSIDRNREHARRSCGLRTLIYLYSKAERMHAKWMGSGEWMDGEREAGMEYFVGNSYMFVDETAGSGPVEINLRLRSYSLFTSFYSGPHVRVSTVSLFAFVFIWFDVFSGRDAKNGICECHLIRFERIHNI